MVRKSVENSNCMNQMSPSQDVMLNNNTETYTVGMATVIRSPSSTGDLPAAVVQCRVGVAMTLSLLVGLYMVNNRFNYGT